MGYTEGFTFSPKTDINVTSLGSVFPDGSNNVHGVTIWDGSQNILASTTVTGSGGDRGFVFSSITPVILTANSTYVIGSTTSTDGVAIDFPVIDGEINYLAEAEENGPDPPGTTPVYPDQSYAGSNSYSANFQFVVLPGTAEFPFAESAPDGGQLGRYTITNNSTGWYIAGFDVGNPMAGNPYEPSTTQPDWSASACDDCVGGLPGFSYSDDVLSDYANYIGPGQTSSLFFFGAPPASDVVLELVNADGQTYQVNLGEPAVSAPEPSTWAMMLIAFAGLGFAGYRRARVAASAA